MINIKFVSKYMIMLEMKRKLHEIFKKNKDCSIFDAFTAYDETFAILFITQ